MPFEDAERASCRRHVRIVRFVHGLASFVVGTSAFCSNAATSAHNWVNAFCSSAVSLTGALVLREFGHGCFSGFFWAALIDSSSFRHFAASSFLSIAS